MTEMQQLIEQIREETEGTKREKLGMLICSALRLLDERDHRIIRQHNTGRID